MFAGFGQTRALHQCNRT